MTPTSLRLAGALALLSAASLAAAAETPAPAARSLEAIQIEGVVDGPEVLFINAREPARLTATHGWTLLAAAGLLEPALPAPLRLEPTEVPDALLAPAIDEPTTTTTEE